MTDPVLWILVCLQIVMGGFDILYHHEFTERLAWRPSAATELVLHAARNGLYAVLFLTFAWFEPHGIWAGLFAAVICVEILITLWDFVEEDLSRKLPASERITHTLLAINYGAIMAYLLPVLLSWTAQASRFEPVSYGVAEAGSIFLTLCAAGVCLFAVRDVFVSRRVRALDTALNPAENLAVKLDRRYRVVVTGGTGFVGSRLVDALSAAGHAVIVLTRSPVRAAHLRPPFTMVTDLDQIPRHLRIDAVINLAGEPIGNGLWTRRKRQRALRSRLKITRAVGRFIRRLDTPPKVLVSASAIGFYGLRSEEVLSEADGGTDCFSHRLTESVERAAKEAGRGIARTVCLRIGLVLGCEGGVLGNLLPAFDWGLGGPMGSGRQWMSWIERDDLVRLIIHTIVTEDLDGIVNATAPNPVRNAEFASTLARSLGRPAFFRLPAMPIRLILGDMGQELLLSGQRVMPVKALTNGFEFRYAQLDCALDYCLGRAANAKNAPEPPVARSVEAPPANNSRLKEHALS